MGLSEFYFNLIEAGCEMNSHEHFEAAFEIDFHIVFF